MAVELVCFTQASSNGYGLLVLVAELFADNTKMHAVCTAQSFSHFIFSFLFTTKNISNRSVTPITIAEFTLLSPLGHPFRIPISTTTNTYH